MIVIEMLGNCFNLHKIRHLIKKIKYIFKNYAGKQATIPKLIQS